MYAVPFKLHTPDAVFTETEGLAQLFDDSLRLQIETKDTLIGRFKQQRDRDIPLEAIAAVEFTANFFKTEIFIQVGDLTTLKDFPGHRLGQIRLRFKRQDRDPASRLAELLNERLRDLDAAWNGSDDTPVA